MKTRAVMTPLPVPMALPMAPRTARSVSVASAGADLIRRIAAPILMPALATCSRIWETEVWTID